MPVLINSDTGYAEQVQDANEALASGKYTIPVIGPEGDEIGVSAEEAPNLLAQGYRQPNEAELQNYLKAEYYSRPSQMLKQGVEAIGRGALGPLVTAGQVAGGLGEEVQERRQYGSEAVEAIGQGIGLIGSAITGVGLAPVAAKVASLAPAASSVAGRIGTTAAKMAIENAVIQSGDEISKMLYQDPEQTAETAMLNIGMAGALGAAFGGVGSGAHQLWSTKLGPKLTSTLEELKVLTDADVAVAAKAEGLKLSPETVGATKFSGLGKSLSDGDSLVSKGYKEAVERDLQAIKERTLQQIGRTEDDIANLTQISKFEEGLQLKQKIVGSVKKEYEPIAKLYEELEAPFKQAKVMPSDSENIITGVTNLIKQEGYDLRPNSPQYKFMQDAMEEASLVKTAEDMLKYTRRLSQDYKFGDENFVPAKQLKKLFSETRDKVLVREAGIAGPEVLEKFNQAQSAYKGIMGKLDDLSDQMAVRSPGNVSGFIKNLDDLNEEAFVRKLGAKDNVNLQRMLTEQFPDVADQMKRLELDNILKKSIKNGEFDTSKFVKNIDGLSPEMKEYLLGVEALDSIQNIKQLVDKIPTKSNGFNFKGREMPKGAGAVAGAILSDSWFAGALKGTFAQLGIDNTTDAAKRAFLKFAGSETATNATAFKAMTDYIANVVKGETLLTKAVTGVFKTAPLAINLGNPEKDRKKLNEKITEYTERPDGLLEHNKDAGYYMENETAAMTASISRNIQYLSALKPDTAPKAPLDGKVKANATQEARYNSALDIANTPLLVIDKIKKGTLTTNDIQDISAMYPSLANKLKMKLFEQVVENQAKDIRIPYHTKLSLSLFMGQPLESSMMPASIQSNQPQPTLKTEPANIRTSNKLGNVVKQSQTPEQAREANRATR